MVRADFQRLVPPHDQPGLLVLLVLQQTHVAGTTLLPLAGLADKLEEFGSDLKQLLLGFLVGLDFDLLGKPDYRLEVDIIRLGRLVFLQANGAVSICLGVEYTLEQQKTLRRNSASAGLGLTSSPAAAAASRWALELPELSPRSSSSSFFSFFAPPPNMEKTAAEVTGFSASVDCIAQVSLVVPTLAALVHAEMGGAFPQGGRSWVSQGERQRRRLESRASTYLLGGSIMGTPCKLLVAFSSRHGV